MKEQSNELFQKLGNPMKNGEPVKERNVLCLSRQNQGNLHLGGMKWCSHFES